jgi:hypothetical protein
MRHSNVTIQWFHDVAKEEAAVPKGGARFGVIELSKMGTLCGGGHPVGRRESCGKLRPGLVDMGRREKPRGSSVGPVRLLPLALLPTYCTPRSSVWPSSLRPAPFPLSPGLLPHSTSFSPTVLLVPSPLFCKASSSVSSPSATRTSASSPPTWTRWCEIQARVSPRGAFRRAEPIVPSLGLCTISLLRQPSARWQYYTCKCPSPPPQPLAVCVCARASRAKSRYRARCGSRESDAARPPFRPPSPKRSGARHYAPITAH